MNTLLENWSNHLAFLFNQCIQNRHTLEEITSSAHTNKRYSTAPSSSSSSQSSTASETTTPVLYPLCDIISQVQSIPQHGYLNFYLTARGKALLNDCKDAKHLKALLCSHSEISHEEDLHQEKKKNLKRKLEDTSSEKSANLHQSSNSTLPAVNASTSPLEVTVTYTPIGM